jgi:hypothetical protein
MVFAGTGAGCKRSLVREKSPPDPLLVSKKPVEGKPDALEPRASARSEPPPPPLPGIEPARVTTAGAKEGGPAIKLLGLQPVPPEGH